MWDRGKDYNILIGKFDPSLDNPWKNQVNAAPFNQKFHLILNVAVGGTNSYFPDGLGGKPWKNNE